MQSGLCVHFYLLCRSGRLNNQGSCSLLSMEAGSAVP